MKRLYLVKSRHYDSYSEILGLGINICRQNGDLTKLEVTRLEVHNLKKKNLYKRTKSQRLLPSADLLLVSVVDMLDMHWFPTGGMKILHDAILKSIGTTEEIKISVTRLSSRNTSALSFSPRIRSGVSSSRILPLTWKS